MIDYTLQGKTWALVSFSKETLERIQIPGKLPKSSEKPWLCVQLNPPLPEDSLEELHPQTLILIKDGSKCSGYGLSPEKVKFKKQEVLVRGRWLKIKSITEGPTLVSSLPLSRENSKYPPEEVTCVFNKKEHLASAVQCSLYLGNQNLMAGTVVLPSSQETLLLLKIISPSMFLIERWFDMNIPMYRSITSGVWIKLGYNHPWERSFRKFDTDHLAFLTEKGWWSVPVVSFHNVFESIDLEMHSVKSQWTSGDLVKFSVPLRWGYRRTSPAAELWLLTQEHLPRLENLFGLLSQEELGNLQLACLKDPKGTHRFAVRESITGRSRQYLDFGEEFCSFGGFPNLFTPLEFRLEPPVPRDLLGKLLQVNPGTITVVTMPDSTKSEKASMEILYIQDRSFKGLKSLVDYTIQGGSYHLTSALEKSSLEMGSLTVLPHRPEVITKSSKKNTSAGKTEPSTSFLSVKEEEEDIEEDSSPEKQEIILTPFPVKNPVPLAPVSNSELLLAEREASTNLTSATLWAKVGQLKLSREDIEEGLCCYEHALWVASEQERTTFETEYKTILKGLKTNLTPEIQLRQRVFSFTPQEKKESSAQYAGRINSLVQNTRDLEANLSKKNKWMLWSHIFEINPDAVEEERVKESILSEMSLRGISEIDSFNFIRVHIRNSIQRPQLPSNIGSLLELLTSYAQKISKQEYRQECLGAISLAWECSGDTEKASSLLSSSASERVSLGKIHGTGAAALALWASASTRLGHDSGEMFEEAISRFSQMREGLEKDRVLTDILEQIQYGSPLDSEVPLITKLLEVISTQSSRRQSLQLFDCGPLFFDLGGGHQVEDHIRKLLSVPEILNDPYYLEHALRALRIFQAGKVLDTELSNRITQDILRRDRFEESTVRSLDIVLEGCDSTILNSLRNQIGNMNKHEAILLETSLVRGLAASGENEEALFLLQKRIPELWDYEPSLEKTRLLCRVIPNISHIGRPEIGTELLMSVLEQVGASGLGVREQREILEVCSRTANKLGSSSLVFEILSKIVSSLEDLISSHSHGVSHLFEILGYVVDHVVEQTLFQGNYEKGLEIVQRVINNISSRLSEIYGADHPYFVHQARIKCSVALIDLGAQKTGYDLLKQTAEDLVTVRQFDGRDRVDLCIEAIRALSKVILEDDHKTELLSTLVNSGIGSELKSTFSDSYHKDMIRNTIRELVQKESSYRLALIKARTQEEDIIRSRVLQSKRSN